MKRPSTNIKRDNSIKRVASNIIDSKKQNFIKKESTPILTTNLQSGHGLWCIATEKKPKKEEISTKGPVDSKDERLNEKGYNSDFYNDVDKKLIDKLKRQVVDLSVKLDAAMSKSSEADYLSQRAENNRQIYFELSEKRLKEIKEYEEKQANLEDNISNLNEALTSAKKEISRLQTCQQVEEEKSNNYYELYQSLMIEKERRESNLSSEIHALSTQLNNFSRERENLVKVIQSSPNPNELTANFQKLKNELEDKIKNSEIIILKLQSENADLKKKFHLEEQNRMKLSDIVKQKKEKIEFLQNEGEKYKSIFEECKKEVKWNQNIVLQKESDLKVYSEKIKKLTEENMNLTKRLEKLKTSKGITDTHEENVVQVKQKPFLFGPETDEC